MCQAWVYYPWYYLDLEFRTTKLQFSHVTISNTVVFAKSVVFLSSYLIFACTGFDLFTLPQLHFLKTVSLDFAPSRYGGVSHIWVGEFEVTPTTFQYLLWGYILNYSANDPLPPFVNEVNQAYSRLSTTHGHITDCKLDLVVYAGICVWVRVGVGWGGVGGGHG